MGGFIGWRGRMMKGLSEMIALPISGEGCF